MSAVPSLDIDPFDERFLADPYARHDELRDAGGVVWLEPLQCFAMARHAEVSAALRDHETFCSGRGVGLADFAHEEPWRPPSLLLETDPPTHARTRGLMNRIASIASLKAVRPEWEAKAHALIARLVERRRFDAVGDLAEVFPLAVFPDLIGLPEEGRENLLPYAFATFNAFGPRNAIFRQTDIASRDARAWVDWACGRDRLKAGGWGQAVYRAADEGLCTESEAGRLVRSFLSAGVDTTVNGISHMVHALALHPSQWETLRSRPSLTKKAFEESLRWNSTVQIFFRTTTRAVEVDGIAIPEGAKVLLFLAAANRDPRHWQDAGAFNIDRQVSGHVGFGFGIHQCLGQMVARQEAELVLEALLARCRTIRPAGPAVTRLNNTVHALAEFPVEVEAA